MRRAEVMAVLAMATDLGLGAPLEHTIRSCLLAVQLGRLAGLSPAELSDAYYLTLLRMLGCSSGSPQLAYHFGDEVAFGHDTEHLDYGDAAGFGRWVMEHFAADRPPQEWEEMLRRLMEYTPQRRFEALAGHCEVAQMLASRLGFGGTVRDGVACVFERWDGSGGPLGLAGEALPVAVRLMHLCNELEVHHRLQGREAAMDMARERSGAQFDPALVGLFCDNASSVFSAIERPTVWQDLLAAEPAPGQRIDDQQLIEAAAVMGDFADMKSPCFAGHSAAVATLAVGAAQRLGLQGSGLLAVQVGALSHDLGRVSVTTAIWDKPAPLNDAEWERVRLHPYYSERLLTRAPGLRAAGETAGMHHERCDGSGYHRGAAGAAQPLGARVVAAADVYAAMFAARPHRPALPPDQAAEALRTAARDGRLDVAAVNAVLSAAGDTGRPVRRRWPADLTDREVEVLRHIASGSSIQEAATALHLAPKTVDFHLRNVYSKAGVTTRAGATLFAVQNGLMQVV